MQSGVKVEFPLQGAVASSLIDVWAQLSPQVLHQLMLSPGFSERKHIKENTDVVTVCVWSILIFQSLALKEVNTTSLLRTLSHNIQFFSLTGKFSFSEWHLVCVHVYYCVSAYWTCHHVRFLFFVSQSAVMCCYPWCCGSWAGHWSLWLMGLMMREEIVWSCSTTSWRSLVGKMWWDTQQVFL